MLSLVSRFRLTAVIMEEALKAVVAFSLSPINACIAPRSFHTTAPSSRKSAFTDEVQRSTWIEQNDQVFPPQAPGEERRPAWLCHRRANIKYSPKKMWYIAAMLRGLSIDEALKQLLFSSKKGAHIVREVLLEAQQMAVEQENIEYKSNMYIGESFVLKGVSVKGLRRHARARFGRVDYRHCHYYVRLVEGLPPENYYPQKLNGREKLQEYIDNWRNKRIRMSP